MMRPVESNRIVLQEFTGNLNQQVIRWWFGMRRGGSLARHSGRSHFGSMAKNGVSHILVDVKLGTPPTQGVTKINTHVTLEPSILYIALRVRLPISRGRSLTEMFIWANLSVHCWIRDA